MSLVLYFFMPHKSSATKKKNPKYFVVVDYNE